MPTPTILPSMPPVTPLRPCRLNGLTIGSSSEPAKLTYSRCASEIAPRADEIHRTRTDELTTQPV